MKKLLMSAFVVLMALPLFSATAFKKKDESKKRPFPMRIVGFNSTSSTFDCYFNTGAESLTLSDTPEPGPGYASFGTNIMAYDPDNIYIGIGIPAYTSGCVKIYKNYVLVYCSDFSSSPFDSFRSFTDAVDINSLNYIYEVKISSGSC